MSDMAIYHQLFEKQSEHQERETQSASDQENSATDCCGAFECSGSIVVSQDALSAKAVEHANESGRNCKDREQFHGEVLLILYQMNAGWSLFRFQ
jgi:hypothetical protein